MTDRTWLELVVHPDDVKHPSWENWIGKMGRTQGFIHDPREVPGAWDCEEVNYAAYSDLELLAEAGVRFMGSHGSGYEYSAQIFFSDGEDGLVHYSPPDTWETYRLVVKCINASCEEVDPGDLDRELNLIQRYHDLVKEIWHEG